MIRDRHVATKVLRVAQEAVTAFDASIGEVIAAEAEDAQKAYKRAVGHVMAEIFDRVIEPTLKVHPDLVPPGCEWLPAHWQRNRGRNG
jgi:hypothetical protein